MWPLLLSLLTGILGLLLGFYGRTMYDKLNQLYDEYTERRDAKAVGVVRPIGTRVTRNNEPIDLSSDTGPVMRPRPAAVEEQRQVDRAKILQDNHR